MSDAGPKNGRSPDLANGNEAGSCPLRLAELARRELPELSFLTVGSRAKVMHSRLLLMKTAARGPNARLNGRVPLPDGVHASPRPFSHGQMSP